MTIQRIILIGAYLQGCFVFQLSGQDTTALLYSNSINSTSIRNHLMVLASDSMEGRETAQPGMERAKKYVAGQLLKSGLTSITGSDYFQPVPLLNISRSPYSVTTGSTTWMPGEEYFLSDVTTQFTIEDSQVVVIGYGITDSVAGWNDYENTDVKGKIILLLDGEPIDKKGNSLLTHTAEKSSWFNDRARKIKLAGKHQPRLIIMVHNDYKNSYERYSRRISNGRFALDNTLKEASAPVVYITPEKANKLITAKKYSLKKYESEIADNKKPVVKNIRVKFTFTNLPKKTLCHNVIGYIEGTDRKDEVIVLSAHLDHLGKRDDKIFYGADDDGSGCASLLAMADAFARAKREGKGPSRSLLFIFFTGEEKGLLGSQHYTTNPIIPLNKTMVNLNIDMIGRVDTIARSSERYTYLIGSDKLSKELHEVNEQANDFCCDLALDYRYNVENEPLKLYSRSDHYNFAKNNIPVIFYFTGLHEDYHKPTDTIDKIDFDKTAAIAKLVFNTAWELSNRLARITVDVKEKSK